MVGKHIDVGRPVTYQTESLVASDKAVVITRVIGARASDTTTDLAIVSAGDFDSFKALVVSSCMIDAAALDKAICGGTTTISFPATVVLDSCKPSGASSNRCTLR